MILLILGSTAAGETSGSRRLALLVAAPWEGETAMHDDLAATYTALRQRGFAPEEFLVLEGPLTRSLVLAFLQDVHRRIAPWPTGDVWFSFSGHGHFIGTTASDAIPGLLLASQMPPSQEQQVSWEEVFAALRVPTAVQLVLLPDS
jgi:hypothetical protein